MVCIGYSGYYKVGILRGADNAPICHFGYSVTATRGRGEYQAIGGISAMRTIMTIDVLGEENIFEARQYVVLENGKRYRVAHVDERLINNYGNDLYLMRVSLVQS